MPATAIRLILGAMLMAALAAPAAADPTPRLWGTSYAIAASDNVVLGRRSTAVQVSARLPRHLLCARVEAVSYRAVPPEAMLRDPLIATPVKVVMAPAACRGDWRDRWANFIVGRTGSDILDVELVSPEGRPLMRERIAWDTSTGGGGRR
jgi:hypothetical protein